MFELDHIAVSAAHLGDGAAQVEAALGVPLQAGGEHPQMGTHNRLLGMGPADYLEVIAIDPAAPAPAWPRWFGLDGFAGAPRLTNWICRVDDLDSALGALPPGAGKPMDLARGDLRWRMAVPESGLLPFDNLFPALIEWRGPRPHGRLSDSGCRLRRLEVFHPRAEALRALLPLADARVTFHAGEPALRAAIATPGGERLLA